MSAPLLDLGGTLRARSAEQTLAAIRPLFQRFGITRLANVTGLDTVGIPVWMAIRPTARSLTVSQGKGITDALAMASAAMESIELYHSERCVPPGSRHSIGEALRSERFVRPTQFVVRSDVPFRESIELDWIDATDYVSGEPLKVPRELLDRDARVDNAYDRLFLSSSNGLASGNTRDEAILHGLCEVIERDQVAYWTVHEGLTRPRPGSRVDPDSVDDPVCAELIARIRAAGLQLALWHANVACDVPAFLCSTWDEQRRTLYPTREGGYGAHPFKRVALSRALTESVQSRLTHISGARDDVFWSRYLQSLDVNAHGAFTQHMKRVPMDVDYRAIPEASAPPDAGALLRWLVDRLQTQLGSRCLVVDLSEPELPFNVVHVLAPGLDVSPQKALYTPSTRMLRYLERVQLL